uniref:Putative replicase n=1 Tax=Tohsystermes virus TaxID=2796635 RepID=A0A7T7GV29_9VIRU|nr:putative replicase [Tohsystermes virus]
MDQFSDSSSQSSLSSNISRSAGAAVKALRVLRDVTDAKDDNVVLAKLLQSQLSKENSTLGVMLTNAVTSAVNNSLISLSKVFNLNVMVTSSEIDILNSFYPGYSFDTSRISGTSPHALAKEFRRLEMLTMLEMAGYRADGKVNDDFDVSVVDVGSNVSSHVLAGRKNIHCCCPVLDANDERRDAYNRVTLQTAHTEEGSAADKLTKRFFMNDESLICRKKSQNCTIKAPVCIFLHSTYDMKPCTIADIMYSHGSDVGHGTFIYDPEILLKNEGEHKVLKCRWKHVMRDGVRYIRFSFLNDLQLGYEHRFDTYVALISASRIYTSDFLAAYSVSFGNNVHGVQYFSVYKVKAAKVPHGIVFRDISVPQHRDKVVVKSWKYDVMEVGLVPVRLLVPRKLYENLYSYCMGLSEGRFTIANVNVVANSFNRRVIISGVAVQPDDPLPPDVLADLAVAVYLMCYVVRYNQARVIHEVTDDIKEVRSDRGSLLSALVNWVFRIKPIQVQPEPDYAKLVSEDRLPETPDIHMRDLQYARGLVAHILELCDVTKFVKKWSASPKYPMKVSDAFTYLTVEMEVTSLLQVYVRKEMRKYFVHPRYFDQSAVRDAIYSTAVCEPPEPVSVNNENSIGHTVQDPPIRTKFVMSEFEPRILVYDSCSCEDELELCHTPGDGNCGYYAVIGSLGLMMGPDELRVKLAGFADDKLKKCILVKGEITPQYWMNDDVLILVAKVFSVNICIHTDVGCEVLWHHDYSSTIHVRHSGNHFEYYTQRDSSGYVMPTMPFVAECGEPLSDRSNIWAEYDVKYETEYAVLEQSARDYAMTNFDFASGVVKTGRVLARSAFKLAELDTRFRIVPSRGMFLDLCAAPGSFSQYLSRRYPGRPLMVHWYSAGSIKLDKSLRSYALVTPHGGNLTHIETIESVVAAASAVEDEVTCVVADGAVNDSAEANDQLILSEIFVALSVLEPGSDSVFLLKTLRFTPRVITALSFMKRFFEDIIVTRPLTVRTHSSERYVIFRGFRTPVVDDVPRDMMAMLDGTLEVPIDPWFENVECYVSHLAYRGLVNAISTAKREVSSVVRLNRSAIDQFIEFVYPSRITQRGGMLSWRNLKPAVQNMLFDIVSHLAVRFAGTFLQADILMDDSVKGDEDREQKLSTITERVETVELPDTPPPSYAQAVTLEEEVCYSSDELEIDEPELSVAVGLVQPIREQPVADVYVPIVNIDKTLCVYPQRVFTPNKRSLLPPGMDFVEEAVECVEGKRKILKKKKKKRCTDYTKRVNFADKVVDDGNPVAELPGTEVSGFLVKLRSVKDVQNVDVIESYGRGTGTYFEDGKLVIRVARFEPEQIYESLQHLIEFAAKVGNRKRFVFDDGFITLYKLSRYKIYDLLSKLALGLNDVIVLTDDHTVVRSDSKAFPVEIRPVFMYEEGNSRDEYVRNACREFLEYSYLIHLNQIATYRLVFDRYIKFFKGEKPWKMNVAENSWLIGHNEKFLFIAPSGKRMGDKDDREFKYGFDGNDFVLVAGSNCWLLVGEYTTTLFEKQFYDNLVLVDLDSLVLPEVEFVMAVPGAGKTTYIVDSVAERIKNDFLAEDVVVCATKEGCGDVRDRLVDKLGMDVDKTRVRTLGSMLLNKPVVVKTLWVDEAMMHHAGAIGYLILLTRCQRIVLVGDNYQIPFVSRAKNFILKYAKVESLVSSYESLLKSYRVPIDVATKLSRIYNRHIVTTNRIESSITVRKIFGVDQVPFDPSAKYLVFTQAEKRTLLARYPDVDVSTVHQYQGKQARDVILVRLNISVNHMLFRNQAYQIVAMSRHTNSLCYCTVVYDEFCKLLSFVDTRVAKMKHYSLNKAVGYYGESVCNPFGLPLQFRPVSKGSVGFYEIGGSCYQTDVSLPIMHCVSRDGKLSAGFALLVRKDHEFIGNFDFKFDELVNVSFGDSGRKYYHLVTKSRYFEKPSYKSVRKALDKLLVRLLIDNVKKIVLPRIGCGLDGLSWVLVKKMLKEVFFSTGISLYVYDGFGGTVDSHMADTINSNLEMNCVDNVGNWYIPGRYCDDVELRLDHSVAASHFVTDPLALQYVYDGVMPNSSFLFNDFDDYLVHKESLEIPFSNLRMSNSVFDGFNRLYDCLRPALSTTMSMMREYTRTEMLLAARKRNDDVPVYDRVIDDCTLAEQMYTSVVKCFDSELYNMYRSVPISVGYVDILSWLTTQQSPSAEALRMDRNMFDMVLRDYEFTIKRNPKPVLTLDGSVLYAALQTIVYTPKSLNMILCVVFRELKERLIAMLPPKIMIFSDDDVEELAIRMSSFAKDLDFDKLNSVELDLSKYDKSQSFLTLYLECIWMRDMGVPEWIVALWYLMHETTRLNDRKNKFSFWVMYQRKSGDPSTFIGNTFFLLSVLLSLIDVDMVELMMLAGDDSLVLSVVPVIDLSELVNNVFNLEAKFFYFKYFYFCSKFVVFVDGRWYVVPDPVKMLIKLGRKDIRTMDHLEEYVQSHKDLCKLYDNYMLDIVVEEAITERYPWMVGSVRALCGSLYYLFSSGGYRELFFSRPGDVLCYDTCKPKLD